MPHAKLVKTSLSRCLQPRLAARAAVLLAGAAVVFGAFGGAASADELTGRWQGTWQSCTDQFHGKVNARIKHCGGNRYEAVFTGTAFKIMPYRYKSTLYAERDPETGQFQFRASQKLPFWGCHWMNGWTDGCSFVARYHTDDHVGYFRMRKVCCR